MTQWGPNNVAAGDDDAYENQAGGGFNSISTTVLCIGGSSSSTTRRTGGFRFDNVTVPIGATIDSADFEVICGNSALDEFDIDTYMHLVADTPDFAVANDDVHTRWSTEATTNKENFLDTVGIYIGSDPGTDYTSLIPVGTDFKAAIQEVIDLGGWDSGQALMVLVAGVHTDPPDSFSDGEPRSYERNSGSDAARLTINYTASGGGGVELVAMERHYPRGSTRGNTRGVA